MQNRKTEGRNDEQNLTKRKQDMLTSKRIKLI